MRTPSYASERFGRLLFTAQAQAGLLRTIDTPRLAAALSWKPGDLPGQLLLQHQAVRIRRRGRKAGRPLRALGRGRARCPVGHQVVGTWAKVRVRTTTSSRLDFWRRKCSGCTDCRSLPELSAQAVVTRAGVWRRSTCSYEARKKSAMALHGRSVDGGATWGAWPHLRG